MFQLTLIPISPLTLSSLFPDGADVYSRPKGEQLPILFLAANQIACDDALSVVTKAEDLKLFICKEQSATFQQHLRDHFDVWFADESIPIQNKAAMLSEVVRNALSEEFTRNDTVNIVTASKQLSVQVTKLATDKSLTGADLCQILHHDYGTFTHSGNVAFYCSLIATEMGFLSEDVEDIVTGGLLHDLGKLDIDERILNKPGKLDDFEFRIIREHPLSGFRRLSKSNETTRVQRLMTYQHHERLDGKGYPVGIGSDEIDIASRICTVADVFEAMTSNRSYRNALSYKQTLEIMSENLGTAFDKEVFKCWSSIINNRLSK